MTSTTLDTTATLPTHDVVKPGAFIVADAPRPDTGHARATWFYVVAVLAIVDNVATIYGVDVTNGNGYTSPMHEPPRFTMATVSVTYEPGHGRITEARDEYLTALADLFRESGIVPPSVGAGETPEQAYARGQADQKRDDLAEFEAWKERATETAHRYADRNDLCGEFDRCMSDIGLPTRGERTQTWEVTYRVEVSRAAIEDYGDPDGWDAEDLYNRAESGAGEPSHARLQ